LILAWNANVGRSFDRCFIHAPVAQVGIKSHLFRMKIICLCGAFFLMKFST